MTIVLNGNSGITTTGLTTTGNNVLGDSSTDTTNIGNGTLITDSNGNVLIGASSVSGFDPDADNLIIGNGSGNNGLTIYSGATNICTMNFANGNSGSSIYAGGINYNHSANRMSFYTINGSERMVIDPEGYLQAHTGTGRLTSANYHSFRSATNSTTWVMYQQHETSTAGSAYGTKIEYRNVTPNGTGNEFLFCSDMSSTRATIRSNGGLANYQANNANLSDIRKKTDINLAGNYLSKICSIPVKTFKYIDQTDNELNLGVIAQDVEAVAPELIDNTGFGETPEDGIPLKAIYQTDLQYALMKCIQEQQEIINDLKARIETLENK